MQTGKSLSVAVAIPTFNRGHFLLDTIGQVLAQRPPADEVIVVDQSTWYPEGAKEQLEKLAAKGAIRYFRQETPNLPMARNRALAEARSDVLIFIDDDVRLSPGFVAAHLANYVAPDVWAVCGRVTEEAIAPRPERPRTWPRALDYRFFDAAWNVRTTDFGTVKGGNHSVCRERVSAIGGYDTAYDGVALREESDLALRILKAAGRIVFDPAAHLHHLRAPAGGCRVQQWGDWSAGMSSLRFARKHRLLLGRYFWNEVWHAYRLAVLNKHRIRNPATVISRSFHFSVMLWRPDYRADKHRNV